MIKEQSRYSSISLILTVIALVLSLIVVMPLMGTLKASDGLPRPPLVLIYVIYLLLITGMILSMMGFKRKEKPLLIRWLAFILNLLLLIVIVASIIFAMSMSR